MIEPLKIVLNGHLTTRQLAQVFESLETEIEQLPESNSLIVDCMNMTGYDMNAQTTFIEWNKKWREKISRVAIVTDKWVWHMVISVMATQSKQLMKPFNNLEKAQEWLMQGAASSKK